MSGKPEMMYQSKYSFAAEQAPRENGAYAVIFDDGKTDLVEWTDGKWQTEGIVTRYSGRRVIVPRERESELVSRILGGISLPDGLPEKRNAQAAALDLARHNAAKAARDGVDPDRAFQYRRNIVGFYTIAHMLGVTFDMFKAASSPEEHDATATDRALYEAANAEFPEVRANVERMARDEPQTGSLTDWARGALEKRKPKANKVSAAVQI
ncbi:UNVERIFIED_ORG: hypothetical protein J2791_002999 [Burkholderia contaminans]|nr:hypothetical protein [Burkholderia contaminans]